MVTFNEEVQQLFEDSQEYEQLEIVLHSNCSFHTVRIASTQNRCGYTLRDGNTATLPTFCAAIDMICRKLQRNDMGMEARMLKHGRIYDVGYGKISVDREELLLNTPKGQEILYWIFDNVFCGADIKLPIPESSTHELAIEKTSSERWYAEEKRDVDEHISTEDEIIDTFIKLCDSPTAGCVYVLELMHVDTMNTAYYVGKSTKPLNRLSKHCTTGGDFSGSHKYEITGLHSIYYEETEKTVYKRMQRNADVEILGGR